MDVIRQQSLKVLEETKNMDLEPRRIKLRTTIAKLAKQLGVGNCEELATVAFLTLIKNNYQGKIEFVAFQGVDHVFVVLNRPDGTDPTDWKTWGANTIILDPWINRVFRANEFGNVWKQNTLQFNPQDVKTFIKFDDSTFRTTKNTQPNLLSNN